jgi:methyl-accepting chemotaxis protein
MPTVKNPFAHLSLSYKVALAPALVAFGLCIVVAVGTLGSRQTQVAMQDLAQRDLPRMAHTGTVYERLAHLNGMVMQSLAYEGVGLKADTIAALDKRILAEFDALAAEIDTLQAAAARDQPGALPLAQASAAAFKTFRAAAKDTLDMKSMGLASAYGVMARSESSYAELRKSLAAIVEHDVRSGNELAQSAASTVQTTITTSLALALAALALSALATWSMARAILGPLRRAVEVARTVASGNLSSHIEAGGRDETGQLMQALREMNDSLILVVERVRAGSDSIATGSSQIATGNADLSQRTELQASSLEETAASMEQLSATVKNNAQTAREAAQLAASASTVATQGGAVVGEVVATMSAISAAASKIANIIGVIDGIAFQTNILALNAAVEAARAGEQGRGFAVVAGEVRALAHRSADAAREIKVLIGASTEKVEAGSRLVGRAGTTMAEIVAQVKRVSDLILSISNATGEQTRGIEQVSEAVTQLDQVTQQNAALVEQSAAAAESLKQQTQRLVEAVGVFKLASTVGA